MPTAPFINAQNASALALKRWEVCPTHAKPEPAKLEHHPEPIAENTILTELACVRDQLKALNVQLEDCSDPDEWDALTRSKERLFRIWARLAQIPSDPKPVQLKAPQQRPATVQPIGPAPTAAPQANPGAQQGQ